jgi:hypothetical protein
MGFKQALSTTVSHDHVVIAHASAHTKHQPICSHVLVSSCLCTTQGHTQSWVGDTTVGNITPEIHLNMLTEY